MNLKLIDVGRLEVRRMMFGPSAHPFPRSRRERPVSIDSVNFGAKKAGWTCFYSFSISAHWSTGPLQWPSIFNGPPPSLIRFISQLERTRRSVNNTVAFIWIKQMSQNWVMFGVNLSVRGQHWPSTCN